MTFQLDESKTSNNFTPAYLSPAVYLQSRIIRGITIHHWGSFGQDFSTVESFLCTNTKPTSAHYVAEAGHASCIVSPVDVAWHTGNPTGNATTIGIECRPEKSPEDFETVAQLIAYLRQNYGTDLPLYDHSDWYATACPGLWAGLEALDARAREIEAAGPVIPNTPDQVPVAPAAPYVAPVQVAVNGATQCVVEAGDTLSLIGQQFGVDWREVAAINGITDPFVINEGQVLNLPETAIMPATQCIVSPGDTLSAIAGQFGVDLQALIAANPELGDPNLIHAGQVLNLPSEAAPAPAPSPAPAPQFNQCVVEEGDTLGGIAQQFGVSLDEILANNPGIDPDLIFPGQVINL